MKTLKAYKVADCETVTGHAPRFAPFQIDLDSLGMVTVHPAKIVRAGEFGSLVYLMLGAPAPDPRGRAAGLQITMTPDHARSLAAAMLRSATIIDDGLALQ